MKMRVSSKCQLDTITAPSNHRVLVGVTALTIGFFFARPASAEVPGAEPHAPPGRATRGQRTSARGALALETATAPVEAHALAFYAELALGARSLNLEGETLRANRPGSTLTVRGDDVRTKGLVETNFRFGLRFHGWMGGIHVGLGLADWRSGPSRTLGDLTVRPDGFVAIGLAAASFGYRFENGPFGARVEGVVGAEIVGLGVERPSFPDTRIPDVNTVRFVAAPRLTLERASHDVSFGIFVQMEPLAPSNVLFGISVTPWAWIK